MNDIKIKTNNQVMQMAQDYEQMYYSLLKGYEKLQEELKATKRILATYTGE